MSDEISGSSDILPGYHVILIVSLAIACLTSLLTEATKDDGTCLGLDRGCPELESSEAFFKAQWHGSKLHSN